MSFESHFFDTKIKVLTHRKHYFSDRRTFDGIQLNEFVFNFFLKKRTIH